MSDCFMLWLWWLWKAENMCEMFYILVVSYEHEFLSVPAIPLIPPPGDQLNAFCLIPGRKSKNVKGWSLKPSTLNTEIQKVKHIVWHLKYLHGLVYMNHWSSDGGIVMRGCETCRWGVAGQNVWLALALEGNSPDLHPTTLFLWFLLHSDRSKKPHTPAILLSQPMWTILSNTSQEWLFPWVVSC